MKNAWVWYVLATVAAVTPAGVKALSWARAKPDQVDPAMAQAGENLFLHKWVPKDPLANGGDGLGPVFNANSCVSCHRQGGTGGGGDLDSNVTTFAVRLGTSDKIQEGVVHAAGGETLADVHPSLPHTSIVKLEQILPTPGMRRANGAINVPRGVRISQLNTPALFGANEINAIPDREIIAMEKAQRLRWGMAPAGTPDLPVGRAIRTASGRVGHFGWKAQSPNLGSFVQAACANELGLGNPGAAQPRPLNRLDYVPPGMDLTQEQCDQITSFVAALPRPVESTPADPTEAANAKLGKEVFSKAGCADCHVPDMGNVKGIYSDMLVHRMGAELEGGGSYYDVPLPPVEPPDDGPIAGGAAPAEWRTPPLWGVADSAPYLHDGRAATLEDAIKLHAGQGARSASKFAQLPKPEQLQLVAFLKTLRAPTTK